MKIAVTTPTGHIGSRVVDRLLDAGAEVVVLARHPERLPEPVRARATVRQGTLEDAAFVADATAGVDALFALVPPNFGVEDLEGWQLAVGGNIAEAVRRNRIGRVVFLSSAGAHRSDLGPISRLGEVEKLLESAAPNVVSIRAGFFMENLLGSIDTIRAMGTAFSSPAPDQKVTFVATRDLGDAAAALLLDARWSGDRVQPLYGPREVTFAEVAELLGEAIGQSVSYVQVPREGIEQALLQGGVAPGAATTYAKLYADLARLDFPRVAGEQAGLGATTIERWVAEVFVPAFGQPVPA